MATALTSVQNSRSNTKNAGGKSKAGPKSAAAIRGRKSRQFEITKKMAIKKGAVSRKSKHTVRKQINLQTRNPSSSVVQTSGQTNGEPVQFEAKGAGTFDGDLRQLPQTKPIRQERPKLRQPNIKPRIYVPPPTIKPD